MQSASLINSVYNPTSTNHFLWHQCLRLFGITLAMKVLMTHNMKSDSTIFTRMMKENDKVNYNHDSTP